MIGDTFGWAAACAVQEVIRRKLYNLHCHARERAIQSHLYDLMPQINEQFKALPSIKVRLPFEMTTHNIPMKLKKR